MNRLKETAEVVVHTTLDEPARDFNRPHVWFCDLDDERQLAGSDRAVLSTEERARADRLKSMLERRRFTARCCFVRQALGNLVGLAPAALEFRPGTHGKPRLAFPAAANNGRFTAPHFNLSHSENVLVLAVAFCRQVGIDVEVVKPGVDVLAVAETHFVAEDFEWLRALPESEVTSAFYRLWTRQEALAKMDGRGIALRSTAARLTDWQWTLHSFELNLGEKAVVGALALGSEAVTPGFESSET